MSERAFAKAGALPAWTRIKLLAVLLVVMSLTAAGLISGVKPASAATVPTIAIGPDMVVGEADGTITVPVTLSSPSTSTVTVLAGTVNGTATGSVAGGANIDYLCPFQSGGNCANGTLTFAPGQTTATIRIPLLENATATGQKSFLIQLSAPSNATIARAVVRINIVDNQAVVDTPPLSVLGTEVDATAGTVSVPVVMGGLSGEASNNTVTVNYTTVDGTAVAGTDYTATSHTLTFAPGETAKNIVVQLLDHHTSPEPATSFSVTLSAPTNATIADTTARVVIGAHDAIAVATPAISIAPDTVVGEGDGYLDVPVTLSAPGQSTVTVAATALNVIEGTATGNLTGGPGIDYLCPNDSGGNCTAEALTFTPGQTTATIRIPLLENATATGQKSFLIQLSAPSNATIARAVVRINIVDNQAVVDTPPLSVLGTEVDATAGTVSVPVVMGGLSGEASNNTVTVNYTTVDGTAVAGTDYTATSHTLTFAPGETAKNIVVQLLDHHTSPEPATSFSVTLSAPTNATIADTTARVVIGAHDAIAVATPAISIAPDTVVGEGDGYLDVPVTLSAPGQSTVTVAATALNVIEGTATGNLTGGPGIDYLCPNDSGGNCTAEALTFTPGQTTATIRIPLLENATATGQKSFLIQLSAPSNATIARAVVRINIVDNQAVVDTPPLSVLGTEVDATAGTVSVPVVMGGLSGEASNSTVTVNYTTVDGTAVAGTDYTATSHTLTFAPGETAKNIVVQLLDHHTSPEPATSFSVTLSAPTNATIADTTARVVIGAHDAIAVATPAISIAPDTVVGEGDGYLDVPVTLSAPGQSTVTVAATALNVIEGTATGNLTGGPGIDYLCPNDSGGNCTAEALTFTPGQTTATIRIPLLENATATGQKSFLIQLSAPSNATIARAVVRINIVDNQAVVDTPPLSVLGTEVDATAGTVSVPVVMGGLSGEASNSTVTVNYTTVDGTAVAGTDYTATSHTLTFAPGETAKNIVVQLLDHHTSPEPATSFSVTLSAPTNATIADTTARVVIGAHDAIAVATPAISIAPDTVVGEGDGYLDVPVTLSAPGQSTVTVAATALNVIEGTATGNLTGGPGIDYLCPNDSGGNCTAEALTFTPGQTTATIRIPLLENATATGQKSFLIQLSAPSNATIARAVVRINIVDNQAVVDTPPLSVLGTEVDATAGTVSVPVVMGGLSGEASNSTVTVNYTTVDGTAVAGTDYTATSHTLTFAPGETAKNIVVQLLDHHTSPEPATSFSVTLSAPTNATIADTTARVVIGAHDAIAVATPAISIAPDTVVGEGDGYLDVPVTLSAPGQSTVTVAATTFDGTAKGNLTGGAGIDYLCPNDSGGNCAPVTLTFTPGQTTATIRIPLLENATATGQKSFTIQLSSATHATIADATTTITITTNEVAAAPSSAVSANPPSVPADGATPSTITVTLTDSSGGPVADKSVSLTPTAGSHSVISTADTLSNGKGEVTFTVTDATAESVTYTATDTTDGVTLTETASVMFTAFTPTVPGAPTAVTAVAGDGSAVVTFRAPASNGGSPITSYTATATDNSNAARGRQQTTGAASPLTVAGLTNGDNYTFTVTAANSLGSGPASARSNAVVPAAVPGAPTGVKALSAATATSTGAVTVTFTLGANNGSAISRQTATCASSNGGVTRTATHAGASAAPITVASLTTAKTYTCTVTATNARGASPASPPSLPVTVGAPAAPTGVKAVSAATATSSGAVTVTFTLGANNGSAISRQTATCASSNGGVTRTATHAGASAAPITVASLTTARTYTCTVTATNARGAGPASPPSLPVTVGAPAAPTGVKAVSAATATSTGAVTVTFTLGANNGSAITGQTATCASSNGGVTRTGTHAGASAAPITVASLTTARTYTCTVTATNARGASPASPPSLPVTVGAPAAPTAVTASRVAAGQIRVKFTPGANNGSKIIRYTARCVSSNGGVTTVRTGAASPLTVVGLTAGKSYVCTVTATNARGTSPASTASRAVTA